MPTDPKTVASYDAHAESWAQHVRAGKSSAHTFLEKPAMEGLLPDLVGKKVLALGVGSGFECTALIERGASVTGIDISAGLIGQARSAHPDLDFRVMDMEKLDFPKGSFDFVYSSLALHYLSSWKTVLGRVRFVLADDGQFLFSVHHPLRWGAQTSKDEMGRHVMLGYTKKKDESVDIYGDYLGVRQISDTYMNMVEVTYWNRPIEEMLRDIREGGFELLDMREPKATIEAQKKDPAFFQIYQKMPLFVLFLIQKR